MQQNTKKNNSNHSGKDKRKNTDFKLYGTFGAGKGEILKKELEKSGIPVKDLYPATNVGRTTTAKAYFSHNFKLLIRACDFDRAEEVRKRLNIESVGGNKMKIPGIYKLPAGRLTKILGTITVLTFVLSFPASFLIPYFKENSIYFVPAVSGFLFLTIMSLMYDTLKKKLGGE